ncbi:ribbon-helix-helix domain-containing protein [Neorhizobium galegae]|uniref:Ribbon-helix-helix protein CopG domain-containing protein n=1 Tax=Neorhizobium galegae bv. officinalis TaxID=323656 RepID=A0A0T7H0X2_NEOGA|nr:ribbon-helix-helix domain-containing protein [Neorhizobium galegae]CDZ53057.1 Hypothetical protein NGAL_HAMBI1189_47970 [Neorhizobium galegae bv. officinalis]
MAEPKTERVPVMFEKDLIEQIDSFSYENRIRTRAAAIRALIRHGLEELKTEKADAPRA